LKKRSKKRLIVSAAVFLDKAGRDLQKFFGSRWAGAAFFQKRTALR
jgi:hypothetical protein